MDPTPEKLRMQAKNESIYFIKCTHYTLLSIYTIVYIRKV